MKLEASLVLASVVIATLFVLTRDPLLMGALAFVATPLFVVACIYYVGRVVRDLRSRHVL
jgi:hypothetical protein